MDPDLIAEVRAAIVPPSSPVPATPPTPTAEPPAEPTTHRRGRPPKKPDEAYLAARAAITGEPPPNAAPLPPEALPKRPYSRATFRKLPGKLDGQPLDLEAAKAILKPRDGIRREWPPIPVGPKAPPPRLSQEEMNQVVALYLDRYGPILNLDQAADVAKLSKQTLRRFVSEGCFANSVYRGRPLRFLTQRFIGEVLR